MQEQTDQAQSEVKIRPGRFFELIRPFIIPLAGSLFLVAAASSVGLLMPAFAGKVVDTTIQKASLSKLNWIALQLIALFAINGCLSYAQAYLLSLTGARLLLSLRKRLFEHLLVLSQEFYESRRLGELLSRMGSDLLMIQNALTGAGPTGLWALLQFIGTLAILIYLNPSLTLISLAAIPPVVLAGAFFGRVLRWRALQQQDVLANTSALAEDVLSGIRTVQSVGREIHEAERYDLRLKRLVNVEVGNAKLSSGVGALLGFTSSTSFVMVLWHGGRLILDQKLTPGELTSFLLYMGGLASSILSLGKLYTGYHSLVGSSTRIFEILDTVPAIRDARDAVALVRPKGHIQLHDVSFRYPSSLGQMALKNVSLDVQPGEMVALIGPSGAGKSTIFSLLLRFYDPTSGIIRLDGHDIRSFIVRDLRRSIGFVPQDIYLFNGTVEDNIAYGDPNATSEQIEMAAKAAGADEFIQRMPNRYQEPVGPRGIKLSAGQRQRIAIARAFLMNPSILLLDEATSSLDPDSEEHVRCALNRLLRERTTLVIAHRLATARQADRILVLEKGTIIANGTHDELSQTHELYQRYWELQSRRGRAEAAASS